MNTQKLPAPSEHESQCAFFTRVALDPRTKDLPIFAIPNGGHRHVLTAKRLKAEGVKAGVPDIFVAVPLSVAWDEEQKRHGMFIEMKRKPNHPTDAQVAWINLLISKGYHVVVCYSADDAWNCLMEYLGHQTPTPSQHTESASSPASGERKPRVWQSVATAPKDGTPILIYVPTRYQGSGGVSWACFVEGEWLDSLGIRLREGDISHWMPMPDAPIEVVPDSPAEQQEGR